MVKCLLAVNDDNHDPISFTLSVRSLSHTHSLFLPHLSQILNPQMSAKQAFHQMEPKEVPDMAIKAHKKDVSESPKTFDPRSYQTKVFEVPKRKDTIVVMETCSGKTMIAVMLIRDAVLRLHASGLKKLIIFLAPKDHVVDQMVAHTSLDYLKVCSSPLMQI